MPLNKLENFIKNTDGRTLYVNPADLNATDSITNQGTSLTEPFRTVQRALIEAARFSYVRGDDNDLIEKTTIVLYPGEHTIDNRPGYGIKLSDLGDAVAVSPSGQEVPPTSVFNLTSDTNFDIESDNNILWHFNSIYGGCVVPRGTSIVGMDLRKTKIRPKYVPNPTDPAAFDSAIFRITGTCYFWQFTIFDGAENGFVFTDPRDFTTNNQSRPTFSHHKLTAFEYADGVNRLERFSELTDLQMYYSKLTNAFNEASGRPIDEKYPDEEGGFAPQRPEFEIVGAFATDPVRIANLQSGDGFTPDSIVTVDTAVPHELSVGTPIKIRDVAVGDYNISTKVSSVISANRFTYTLSVVRPELPPRPSVSGATVTVETDTVTGASPYIFNVSMRSVWGINGMHADGAKATGFRSMVVAQFTAISLQKDDRAFVKYNEQARRYDGINVSSPVRGAELSAQSSSTNSSRVYHLDPQAIYRPGWDTTHIKMSNDAVIQIVSVFAIGFNQHFAAFAGADASITNSNSNFGQFALLSDGFKNDAFTKDDKGFISQIITPNNGYNPGVDETEVVNWVNLDFAKTRSIGKPGQLYLLGYTNKEDRPPFINQGFRIGANNNETLYQQVSGGGVRTCTVKMVENLIQGGDSAGGNFTAKKVYEVKSGPGQGTNSGSTLNLDEHGLIDGESIRLFSATGDLPEGVEPSRLYYADVIDKENIRIATSESNALNGIFLEIYGGSNLRVESRVNDKESGERGHPLQYDEANENWFIFVGGGNQIFSYIDANPGSTDGTDFAIYFERNADNRSLDDKLYRLRYVIPKDSLNAKPPTPGYVIQDSSSTGPRDNDDFTLNSLSIRDYEYDRNPRFIEKCTYLPVPQEIQVETELPHQVRVGDRIDILNVSSKNNLDAVADRTYNGDFIVTQVDSAKAFRYSTTDVNGFTRDLTDDPVSTNDVNDRNILLPRFQKKDNQKNVFVYRIEEITPFAEGVRDGIYHLFCINGSNKVTETFTDKEYNQPIEDLYPQLDIDNVNDNPNSSVTFANRAPLGKVNIDDQQNSITRETLDKFMSSFNKNIIANVIPSGSNTILEFEREHNFGGVYGYPTGSLVGGSGFTNGTFYNVKLLDLANANPTGATATVTITGGSVTSVVITDPGSAYIANNVLTIDPTGLGGSGATIRPTRYFIESGVGIALQITGGGSENKDVYADIISVPRSNRVVIRNASIGSNEIIPGMYAIPTDIINDVDSYSYNSSTELSTFTRNDGDISPNTGSNPGGRGFGLQRGNSFIAFSSNGTNLGKFYVTDVPRPNKILASTPGSLSGVSYIVKCGLEDNDAPTGSTGENIGVRGVAPFDNGHFWLTSSSGTGGRITLRGDAGWQGTDSIPSRLPLGRYLQVGSEIMRVSNTVFSGSEQNIVSVLRGALGTQVLNHPANSKVRAINPIAVELRRPSILRASGHTFEYLGYGPGNYSTSLPQLQVRQLPDDEVYLVQAQELACGQVVYTGMSDNGDFYIGNTKYSATSGTQVTFDVPVPTVAGQAGSSNNVVFDEVIINRRLFVAGGEENNVLTQFDGPVKFTQSISLTRNVTVAGSGVFGGTLRISSPLNSSNSQNGGAFTVAGGGAIAKDFYVGGDTDISGDLTVGGVLDLDGDFDLDGNLTVGGNTELNNLSVSGTATFDNGATFDDDISVDGSITLSSTTDEVVTNIIQAVNNNASKVLWTETGTGSITIGPATDDGRIKFPSTQDNTTESPTANGADAAVVIEGGLLVKKSVVADRFIGGGLGAGPGTIVMWGGPTNNIPSDFRLCNGAFLRKNQFPDLFNAIGTLYGQRGAEPNLEFRLPDLRERFIVGEGVNSNVEGAGYVVGSTGGQTTVKLTPEQIASHTHTANSLDLEHSHSGDTTIFANGNRYFKAKPNLDADAYITGQPGNNLEGQHIHGGNDPEDNNDPPRFGINKGRTLAEGKFGDEDLFGGRHTHPNSTVDTNPNTKHKHDIETWDANPNAQNARTRGIISSRFRENDGSVRLVRSEDSTDLVVGVNSEGSSHRHEIEVRVSRARSGHRHSLENMLQKLEIDGSHDHLAETTIEDSLGTFDITISANQDSSSVQAHENRPAYFALAFIMQVQ